MHLLRGNAEVGEDGIADCPSSTGTPCRVTVVKKTNLHYSYNPIHDFNYIYATVG